MDEILTWVSLRESFMSYSRKLIFKRKGLLNKNQ